MADEDKEKTSYEVHTKEAGTLDKLVGNSDEKGNLTDDRGNTVQEIVPQEEEKPLTEELMEK